MRAELNGSPATAEQLAVSAVAGYGHFTTMQVRAGRVRGVDAHLRRLATATRTLFGTDLDTGLVRTYLRRAVSGADAVTARVTVLSLATPRGAAAPVEPDVLVTLRAPSEPSTVPVRLRSVRHERVLPEVKHVGTFDLFHHTREAQRAGYDDALFVNAAGFVSEVSVWNIGFFDGERVLWPDAPKLAGTTQLLLEHGLAALGVPTRTLPVSPAAARAERSAFLCNSADPARPVAAIDDTPLTIDHALTDLLTRAFATNAWVAI
ncbi:aminotransferase class IV [Saccharomonospora sp. NPDC046836]|uniref:aminotransferase class IV n=1 Tax=Saccharomonospora sp. NPDC046836 TaxID=3156921 RepID=UPI0033CD7E25